MENNQDYYIFNSMIDKLDYDIIDINVIGLSPNSMMWDYWYKTYEFCGLFL